MRTRVEQKFSERRVNFVLELDYRDIAKLPELNLHLLETSDPETWVRYALYIADKCRAEKVRQ